jgi:hypothetical protein
MEYNGKLYGRIGRRYFDTGHTTKDYDKALEQKTTIYILVNVHYDYFRFQENIFVHSNKEKVIEFIRNHKENQLPVHEYEENKDDDKLWEREIAHWWIQKFEVI